jgi:hypothetical protein
MRVKLKIKEDAEIPLSSIELQIGMYVKIRRTGGFWSSSMGSKQPKRDVWYYGRIEGLDSIGIGVAGYGFSRNDSEVYLLLKEKHEDKTKT